MTTTTEKHTYLRDAVPAERMGQCPCCLRNHRSSKRGTLVRHGWKETGRQVGQHGCGFQWGACIGSGLRHLEHTDADAIVVLARLAAHIKETEKALKGHQKGADSYHHEFTLKTEYEHDDEARAAMVARFSKAFKKLDLEFTDRATQERYESFRVSYHKAHEWRFVVARGADAVIVTYRDVTAKDDYRYSKDSTAASIPSYESLRAACVAHLETVIKSLKRQEKDIEAAVKHHLENPSNGSADTVRRAALVHFVETYTVPEREVWRDGGMKKVAAHEATRIACGKRERTMSGHIFLRKTEKKTEVTCSKCLKARSA